MFQDTARIWVEGGAGGNGVVSFRREAHVPRGGPDGGDGGDGGHVVVVCDPSRRDLASLRYSRHYRGERGRHGEGAQRHGARGKTMVIPVPPGTTVDGLEGQRFDLVEPGQRAVVARGGSGGHGNKRFTTSTRQAPRFSEKGLEGESGWIELRLRLLADAGLIGLPNAGKSSLLGRMTRAAPKVGDYPFTTLEPVLGTLDADDRQVVLADVPGLIEGAAEGAGLGDEFLAHVERCRALLHVVELAPPEGSPSPERAYEVVRSELGEHGAGLDGLPEIVVLSKRDLVPEEDWSAAVARMERTPRRLGPGGARRIGRDRRRPRRAARGDPGGGARQRPGPRAAARPGRRRVRGRAHHLQARGRAGLRGRGRGGRLVHGARARGGAAGGPL